MSLLILSYVVKLLETLLALVSTEESSSTSLERMLENWEVDLDVPVDQAVPTFGQVIFSNSQQLA